MDVVDLSRPINEAAFGELVGISQQAVSEFLEAVSLAPGVSASEMLAAYCDRLREQAAGRLGDTDGLDLVQERAALARAQREGHEIKNAVARGEYASINLMAQTLAMASQAVVERFEQLPGTLKKSCPHLDDATREQIMGVLAHARNEWVSHAERLIAEHLVGAIDAGDAFDDELGGSEP